MTRINIDKILEEYNTKNISIATLASHSSLQILHGAKTENLSTVLICTKDRTWFYNQFNHLVDHMIIVNNWKELCKPEIIEQLKKKNSVIIPHGSYVEYVGIECAENIPIPILGSRYLFAIEADQHKKMELLKKAEIPIPRTYNLNEEIDKPVIVKLPGAKGGKGYFIARSREEIIKKLSEYIEKKIIKTFNEIIIQEYIVGVTAYYHYFYSPVLNRVEILGADIRYESDIDGVKRLPPNILENIEPTFTVVGNIPLVLRESLLPKILEYGIKFVETVKTIVPSGIVGPFCLESVVDKDMNIKIFEFSGRIVAGTNLYVYGSPYSYLYWNEPMSTGRRIARELKMAIEQNILNKILT